MATYKDIRSITGLSLATISKYFNGKNVRDQNRIAIDQAVRELDYRLNTVAQNLRSGRSGIVGVLVPSLENEFHMSIVAGVERRLRSNGLSVLVASMAGQTETRRSVDVLLTRMVDAIVAVPDRDSVDGLRAAVASGIPVIAFDWTADGLEADSVTIDNVRAGRLAASHLLGRGHVGAALIGGPAHISTVRERGAGFAETLRAHGADLEGRWTSHSELSLDAGREAMARLLAMDDRPSAAFSVNAELTAGALLAINESGLRLGSDISLIGFDTIYAARLTRPPLTVIGQPTDEIADAIEASVIARSTAPGAGAPTATVLRARIVYGDSVADLG